MRNLTITALICTAACSSSKILGGREYEPYGFITQHNASPKVRYKVNTGDVVLSVIFCETLAVPLLICGLDIMEPIELSSTADQKPPEP